MRKIVLFILTLLICSSCNRSGTSGAPVLIWWQMGNAQPRFAEDQKVISDYIEEKIGVRVNFRLAGWAEAGQRFTTMLNSGEYFDILFTDTSTYNHYVSQGAFADITNLVKEKSPLLWETIPSILWDGVKINGRIYSVPCYKDSSITGYYFWNDYYVEKYNIDLARTGWKYLDEVFRKIKKGEGQRFYPFLLSRSSNNWIFDYYDSLSLGSPVIGIRIDDINRKVVLTIEQSDIIETLKYFHSWYKDGIINPDANLLFETPAMPNPLLKIMQAWPSVAFSYAVQDNIAKYHAVRFFGPYYSTASIQGSLSGISSNSRHKAESLKLLELVNTDTKLRDMLAYGIEGKHFNYTNDGNAVEIILTDWSLINYQQGNYFIITPQSNVPPSYWEEVRYQNEMATPVSAMGFMIDLEPIRMDLMNCKSAWDRYATDLTLGASDPDDVLPKVIADLKNAGADRLIAEIQRQVDKYFNQ